MKLTNHARKQAQRRGIDAEALDLVLSFGEDAKAGRGCRLYRLPQKEIRYLAEECPPMLWRRYRDRLHSIATVVDNDDQNIITAMHRNKPIWKRFGWHDR